MGEEDSGTFAWCCYRYLCHEAHPAPLEYCGARITQASVVDEKSVVLFLDVTPFYAQGGGQPSDTGTISLASSAADLAVSVEKVLMKKVSSGGDADPIIEHHCKAASTLDWIRPGALVNCSVDTEKRLLHSLLHTAGHMVDAVVESLLLGWRVVFLPNADTRAFHYPEGPYVEYYCDPDPEKDQLDAAPRQIERFLDEMIAQDLPVAVSMQAKTRLVTIGERFRSIPCGGTHVPSTGVFASQGYRIGIRRVKKEGGALRKKIRVAYALIPS